MPYTGEGQEQAGRARRWIGLAFAGLAAGAGALLLGASPAAAAPTAPTACSTSSLLGDTAGVDSIEANAQQDFLGRLNDLRRSKGLGPLVWNGAVAAPAISWSQTMSSQDWLHHARDTGGDDGVEPHQDYVTINSKIVANWQRLAENVGVSGMYGSCTMADLEANTAKAVSTLHDAFVASSGHYANMVGDHNQVGIGVHIDGGKLWVTVRFAKGDLPAGSTGLASTIVTQATASYVDAVYQLFGGRAATSAEKSYWAPAVASGNRVALTSALAVTDSWAGARISELYQTVFQRSADGAGRAYWLDQIRRGLPLESVGVEFYRSGEYFTRSGGTNRAWIEALYDDLLGRTADGGGVSYWLGQLAAGQPRSAVSANFYRSNESRRDRAGSLHEDVLGSRLADPGLQQWADRLAFVGDVRLAADLAATQSFWNLATR
ncbi:MAG TPA: DUF4214 domain-containing protein [Acidimicrobiales bacterium]|nr:DUF4214 domain-containing protein [Acidimicrobiales bacterium]